MQSTIMKKLLVFISFLIEIYSIYNLSLSYLPRWREKLTLDIESWKIHRLFYKQVVSGVSELNKYIEKQELGK